MGEKKRTVVEINGRSYDAATGKIIEKMPTASRLIDGFQAPKTKPLAKKTAPAATTQITPRSKNASSEVHAKPQKTKKLHSSVAAKKPTHPKVKSTVSQTAGNSAHAIHASIITSTPRASLTQDTKRQQRSTQHTKSDMVQRYPKSAEIVPAEDIVEPTIAASQTIDVPAFTKPMPKHESHNTPTQQPSIAEIAQLEGEVVPEKLKKPSRLKSLASSKPKLLPVTMAVVAVLALGGYATYRNIPNMALRVASQKAGFSASLPGYKPAGFSFSGPVTYSNGEIELEYSSNSDERTFNVTQRESNWDSKSLLDNFVRQESTEYLTFQEQGLTVYVYDSFNAAWVDGGIWYTVEGNSLLSSEQLLKIATSL